VFSYNADDEVSTETYDANGNATQVGAKSFTYDSENHMMTMSTSGTSVTMIYDGDGNRVGKSVNGVPTYYLVDDLNPTGYTQVVEELNAAGVVQRQYTYGLQRISENQFINGAWTPSFYGYDGGGNVRNLTNSAGAVTDEYEYDAFGNSFTKVGTTPNNYLYRGEQYDPDLGLYYLRARYYNAATGRFMSRDPDDGMTTDPATLHRYLFAGGDPVDLIDPTGRDQVEYKLTLIVGGSALGPVEAFVGGAVSSAAAWAVGRYVAVMGLARSAAAAVAAFAEALDWAALTKGLTKAIVCGALETAATTLLDKYFDGLSQALPSELTDKFEEVCGEDAGILLGKLF
jgi:RHS repeat-associated protein